MAFQYWPVYDIDPPLNNANAPDGAPEGMPPGDVNDAMRQHMAATAEAYVAWVQLLSNDPSGDPSDPTPLPPNLGAGIPFSDPPDQTDLAQASVAYLELGVGSPQIFTGWNVFDGTGNSDSYDPATGDPNGNPVPTLTLRGDDNGIDLHFEDTVNAETGIIGFDGNVPEFNFSHDIVAPNFIWAGGSPELPAGSSAIADFSVNWPNAGGGGQPLFFTRHFNEEDYVTGQTVYTGIRSEHPTAGFSAQLISYVQEDVGTDYAGFLVTLAGDGSLEDMTWQSYMVYRPSAYPQAPEGIAGAYDYWDFNKTLITSGWLAVNPASGGVALTVNDGGGNANINFNSIATVARRPVRRPASLRTWTAPPVSSGSKSPTA